VSGALDAPRIRFGRDGLHIEFACLFGPGADSQTRRFARRVFAFPQVRSLRLEPDAGKASVHYQLAGGSRADFLDRLAAAIGGTEEGLDESLLPLWLRGAPVTLHRFGGSVSVFRIAQAGGGRLQLRHPALAMDPAVGWRVAEAVRALDGVAQATVTGGTGALWVTYQPDAVDILPLIRAAEAQLASPRTALAALAPAPAKLGFANATLGLAAIGELALPVVLPVCVGMLVAANLGTLRDAGRQLGQGKVGMPILHTALLGCSITTGQIVAHALMEWSFRFWARRSNAALAGECRALLEESLPIPAHSRLVRSDEVDAQVPTETLQAGNHIRIDAPAAIPADGRVVAGSALVEETAVCGSRTPVRKSFGDKVFAGSLVLAGTVEVEVWQAGPQTRAAQIAHSVIEGVRSLARNPSLRRRAEAIADRTAAPALAAAGLGWAVGAGGLFTAGAVLHADYATGPNIAVPLETLRGMGLALRGGAVVRKADALPRLAESRFIVLDDHPAWAMPGLELERMDHRLAESETDNLLRYVAGAGLYLGDERAGALVDASLALGQVIRQPPLVSLDARKVAVRQGRHTLILRNGVGADHGAAQPLTVEIDGEEVATLRFRPGTAPRAAAAVARLRRQGMTVFLLSGHPAGETDRLARLLGIELSGGDFSPAEKLRFLQGLRRRGVRATYIGNGGLDPGLAAEAHVSVSLGGTAGLSDGIAEADIVLLGDALDAFVEVVELASGHDGRILAACRKSLLPNLLCVVGGYAGVLNGITAGLLANVGVNNVYQQATQSLRENQRSPRFKRISV
jgi:cation transport ATPase